MLGFLWRLLVGRFSVCAHEWETVATGPIGMLDGKFTLTGHYYELRCKKCGDVTVRNLE